MKRLLYVIISFFIVSSALYAMSKLNNLGIQVHIEPYKKERDYDFIKAILEADPHNFPDAALAKNIDGSEVEVSLPSSGDQVEKHTFKQNIFVSIIDAKPIGFVRTFNLSDGIFMIAQMGVIEKYRRMGIGAQLLNYAIERLKSQGAQEIILDTMADNVSAHALYEKAGFIKIADLDTHYLYKMALNEFVPE